MLSATLFRLFMVVFSLGAPESYFAIHVVDEQTGRGVPLVELKTTNEVRHYTDSNGYVAFYEPGLMGQKVFFTVSSHGYEFKKDGFGIPGIALDVKEGGSAELKIKRINIAERIYRVTGGGIYRDSVLLGKPVPTRQPVLNGQVFGQDSTLNAMYHGKMWWFWGDTGKPSYPLGNFNMSGATSVLPQDGGLDPNVGVDLTYFVNPDGFAKGMAPVPGPGPTWCGPFLVVRDAAGKERMFTFYVKIKPEKMEAYQKGLLEYNDDTGLFEKVVDYPMEAPTPVGHTLACKTNGQDYFYIAMPFPFMRVKAELSAVRDLAQYESLTCLQVGTKLDDAKLDRDAQGRLVYSWKKGTPPLGASEEDKLVKAGHMKADEGLFRGFIDVETGKPVLAHGASVFWNEYRQRWIMICIEFYGRTMLGELWFAEADSPIGPWGYARRILTHDKYSFYNPKQHPEFDQQGGRIVYFEGTYTMAFSGNDHPTPRYDYNPIMYRMDLSDERLSLPVAIYRQAGDKATWQTLRGHRDGLPLPAQLAFFAPDRPAPGLVPVSSDKANVLHVDAQPGSATLFYAVPADSKTVVPGTLPLFEYQHDGGRDYALEGVGVPPAWKRAEQPLCRVWKQPASFYSWLGATQ